MTTIPLRYRPSQAIVAPPVSLRALLVLLDVAHDRAFTTGRAFAGSGRAGVGLRCPALDGHGLAAMDGEEATNWLEHNMPRQEKSA